MRDVICMWRSTKLAVLAALCAAIYAALLIPFKAIPIIPGFTEVRPANVVPVVTGLLFGPAAAWGCGFGNLIADFFGTIGPGSFFGFIGNFLYAYVPYRLWRLLTRGRAATGAPGQAPLFMFVALVASAACGVIIGWGVDLLGLVPYKVLTTLITLNNLICSVVLGLLIMPLVYSRARRWGLLYEDLLHRDEYREGPLAPLAGALVAAGALGGALVAVNAHFAGESGTLLWFIPAQVPLQEVALVCAGLILVGSFGFTDLPFGRRGKPLAGEGLAVSDDAAAVEVTELGFTYALGEGRALNGISFTQPSGEMRMLMGPTGAGKSTLCKTLNGVIPSLQAGRFEGCVRLLGADIAGIPVHSLAGVVGVVFQDFESQLLTTSVEAEVAFPLENLGVDPDQMRRRVRAALESVDMWDLRAREPVFLSGGEKQRVALAATLVGDPRIVILDEPTTDLDPAGKRELLQQCGRLRAEGRTLIIAEHETELAPDADTLTVLQDGRVAYDGPPGELLCDPQRTKQVGLRPLDVPSLFEALGRPERPLRVEDAAALLRGEQMDEAAWQETSTPWMAQAYGEQSLDLGRPTISVQGVRYVYPGEVEALRTISFDIYGGEFVAILGENGSGKTTLARHLNGLLKPTEGMVLVDGVDSTDTTPAELSSRIGYLFQDPDHQIFAESVYEEVAFGPRSLGMPSDKAAERVKEALGQVGLEGLSRADPFTLTKGQRQQVALASVLAMHPQVIVFDEPTTGLDGAQQKRMMDSLRQLNDHGRTVIVITHCSWAAAQYAHRVIAMDKGQLAFDGPTREFFADDELLARVGQRPPQITRLSKAVWSKTALSVEELARCLTGGDVR